MKKRIISVILTMSMCLTLSVPAFAADNSTDLSETVTVLEDTATERTVSVTVGEYTYITEYNREENILTVSEYQNGNVIDSTSIDMNELMISTVGDYDDVKDQGTRIGYEHTFTNFEYEEYLFDGYQGDAFWFLRNPMFDPDERSVYEHPINGSEYSDCLSEYVAAVETINTSEGVFGVAAALAIGVWLIGKGIIPLPQIQAGVTSILEGLGVFGIGFSVNDFVQAVETCNTVWYELFGVYA